tara:strand:- start:167 stop:472 length:306 start_codon:yes stop_codon:yes gene_type:complete
MAFLRFATELLQALSLIETREANSYDLRDADGLSSALLREIGLTAVIRAVDRAKRVAEATLVSRFVVLKGETEAVLAWHVQSTIESWRGIRTGHVRAVVPT